LKTYLQRYFIAFSYKTTFNQMKFGLTK